MDGQQSCSSDEAHQWVQWNAMNQFSRIWREPTKFELLANHPQRGSYERGHNKSDSTLIHLDWYSQAGRDRQRIARRFFVCHPGNPGGILQN